MTVRTRRTTLVALCIPAITALGAAAYAAAPRTGTSVPKLTADRVAVEPGGTLTLEGTGFPRNAHLALMAGPPHGASTRIGGAETGKGGRFVATIHVRPHSSAGAFVALACHDSCRVKASARFRIVAP
jgi:hypothetical protein